MKANPEIRTYHRRCMECGCGFEYCLCNPKKSESFIDRPIRLADVLLILKERYSIGRVGDKGFWYSTMEDLGGGEAFRAWNLLADDLTLQSEDCIIFIHEILYGKE